MAETQDNQVVSESPVTVNTVPTRPKKSMGIAVTLTVLFGPLGLLYTSISIGLITLFGGMFTGCILALDVMQEPEATYEEAQFSLEIFGALLWLISIILCVLAVKSHNRN